MAFGDNFKFPDLKQFVLLSGNIGTYSAAGFLRELLKQFEFCGIEKQVASNLLSIYPMT